MSRRTALVASLAPLSLCLASGLASAQCLTLDKLTQGSVSGDRFGSSVSLSFGGPQASPLLAVGVPLQDAPGAGVDAGGFTVYRRVNGWSVLASAWNSTGLAGERLGASIALSDPYLIAGAPGFNNNQGRARIFRRPSGSSTWFHSTDVTILPANSPADAGFGSAVAISSLQGGWAVVGAPRHDFLGIESGSAYFYTRDPNTNQWNEAFHIWGGDFGGDVGGHRGEAVAMSQTTPWAIVGSPDDTDAGQPSGHGVVTLVQRMPNGSISAAVQQVRPPSPEAGERFGAAVGIEGEWLVVGAPMEDMTLQEGGFVNAATNGGAAYLYKLVSGTWTFQRKFRAPQPTGNGNFGASVAMTEGQLSIAEPGRDRVYVFAFDASGNVRLQSTLTDSDSDLSTSFGSTVSIYEGIVATGEPLDDNTAIVDAGAAFVASVDPSVQTGDLCSSPLPLVMGDYTGCTDFATPSSVQATTCGNGGSGQGNDVWFSFQPACSGNAVIDTFGSAFDTVLSVHSACPSFAATNSLVCNDDASFSPPNNRASMVTFNFTAGETYLVRVTGYNGANGAFTLRSNMFYPSNPADSCATAPSVGLGTQQFQLCGLSNGLTYGGCASGIKDAWYRFTAPAAGDYTITTCGSQFDTMLDVFAGAACPTSGTTPIACNDDAFTACLGNVLLSRVQVSAASAGQVFTVRVSAFDATQTGLGVLNIAPTNPCNDIDFNNDGIEQDPTDIEAFLSVYSGGPCIPSGQSCDSIDFNNDGIEQDPTDIESFLSVYSGGPCL